VWVYPLNPQTQEVERFGVQFYRDPCLSGHKRVKLEIVSGDDAARQHGSRGLGVYGLAVQDPDLIRAWYGNRDDPQAVRPPVQARSLRVYGDTPGVPQALGRDLQARRVPDKQGLQVGRGITGHLYRQGRCPD
jgi:hypothetical protein